MAARSLIAFVLLLAFALPADAEDATKLARAAFFVVDAAPFNTPAVEDARDDLKRAAGMQPDNVWVLIATSRFVLERGYQHGSRARLSSFSADAVRTADEYAERAVANGPNESMAYVQLARIQVILGSYRAAWDTLNKAHALAPEDFYPWYVRGVLCLEMRDAKRASDMWDEALARAKLPYQRMWTLERRIDLGELQRDVAAQERAHRALLDAFPSDAHNHGNFGNFLLRQKRYDEAIEQYRRAIAIAPYPIAEEQLKKALLLKRAQ